MKKISTYILLGVFVIAGGVYLARPLLIDNKTTDVPSDTNPVSASAPPVVNASASTASGIIKEGEVTFVREGKTLRKIDVEIAENDTDRQKGLMFRPFMADSVGMLFVFDRPEPQGFWMKNTMISLDIIYVDENKKIVSIQKNAKPYSEENLPSFGNAQYVVEVNGGYCDKYGIKVGDSVTF